jgi:subtilisin family serine protease
MFSNNTHGMSVLSLMAGKIPYTAVGTAPEAQYVVMKTEANSYEEILEEYFLVAGLECADSLGTDVVNISLGYTGFDSKNTNHTFSDLNGLHSVASITVSMAVEKGMIVSNSAGNEGNKNWKYISIPADAYNVLSVAAINTEGQLADFSSLGSTLCNKIKPNIASAGLDTYVQKANGNIEKGNGTSFSSPVNAGLVACLRQAFPQKTSHEIIKAIFQSCNHVQNPDTLTGYGIPDYWLAFRLLDASVINKKDIVHAYPNPVQSILKIKTFYPYQILKLEIIDAWGRILYGSSYEGNDFLEIDFSSLASGIYILRIHTTDRIAIKKVIKI